MDVFEIEEADDLEFNPLDEAVAALQQPKEPAPSFLDGLNPEQQEAVESTQGPLLVLSGAGTGKTRVLTTRIAYIIHQRLAYPWQILAVTFTNKAAQEMKARLEKMIGSPAYSVWLGTFHAIGVKILRKHADKLGLGSRFIVLNSDDQERLLKSIMIEQGYDTKKNDPRAFLEAIQRLKDKGLQPQDSERVAGQNILALYKVYQERLFSLNAVDFGDLLMLPIVLFQQYPDVLEEYQNQFKYILVDEYQDTNVAQYLLLRLLSKKWRNICVVGDDDQSIYSWRGAEVENILSFQNYFPDAKVVRLERNYRSTGHILAAASGLIAHNTGRLGKTLYPADGEENQGSKVLVKGFWNGMDEAQWVADEVERMRRNGIAFSEMAVLVRAAFQTRLFEEVFMRAGIPYKIIGGFKFYEREEIKDAVAYLRLVLNTSDDLAFSRIVNKPKRGIGTQALEALNTTAKEKRISLFDAISWASLKPNVRKTLDSFALLIKKAQEKMQTQTAHEVATLILEESGYIQMWQNDKSTEAEGRLENIKELYNVLHDFDNIAEFIEYASLVTDTDETAAEDQLVVMTLHASKGLEFRSVFLPGWEEELFPHKKALDETGDMGLEEERRLAYVGITRARKKVVISFASNRKVYGQWVNAMPSRFIDELPERHIDFNLPMSGGYSGYARSSNDSFGAAYGRREVYQTKALQETQKSSFLKTNYSYNNSGLFNTIEEKDEYKTKGDSGCVFDKGKFKREAYGSGFDYERDSTPKRVYKTVASSGRIGKRVRHEIFGEGTVIREEGDRVDVRFDSGELKKIMARFLEAAD